MGTYRQIFYHIVFGTKYRKPTINERNETQLYKYIWGVLNNKNCKLYRINGMSDHIHIFCDLHPNINLSNLVKDIKVATKNQACFQHLWDGRKVTEPLPTQ
ncbi:Transposase IS200 like protein [compost metagenome]